ncbi:ferredoxin-NADP reductase [Streptomyces sp. SAI-208]|nr:ferredoxin-NADP reductase [Streptomyces sp. SAI-208]
MLSMLHHLAATDPARPVTVLHAERTPADHAHHEEQRRLVEALPNARLHLWYEELGESSREATVGRTDVTALGLPAHAVHYEVFGPDLWLGTE